MAPSHKGTPAKVVDDVDLQDIFASTSRDMCFMCCQETDGSICPMVTNSRLQSHVTKMSILLVHERRHR